MAYIYHCFDHIVDRIHYHDEYMRRWIHEEEIDNLETPPPLSSPSLVFTMQSMFTRPNHGCVAMGGGAPPLGHYLWIRFGLVNFLGLFEGDLIMGPNWLHEAMSTLHLTSKNQVVTWNGLLRHIRVMQKEKSHFDLFITSASQLYYKTWNDNICESSLHKVSTIECNNWVV